MSSSDFPLPIGFRASGVACGLKPEGKDLAIIVSDRAASAGGTFTTNRVQAAPLQVNREHLRDGHARAIVVNSKNANACTGEQGLQNARRTAQYAADRLGILPEEVLVNSTGVIGVPLPMGPIESGVQQAVDTLSENGLGSAAEAIMTTDTVPKLASASVDTSGGSVRLAGMAKGAGMIAPNMATMLGFLLTDAAVDPTDLQSLLSSSISRSFNCITVDGDMSTNDTVLLLANGAAVGTPLRGEDLVRFGNALDEVSRDLAKQIARDGEGATKLITVHVIGAKSEAAARQVGLSVANSNLVKTAVFGRDPNWGRILCAVGYSGIDIDPDRVSVEMAGFAIYSGGRGLSFDLDAAVESLGSAEVGIDIDLSSGDEEAVIYTCDLSYEYVRINAEYTT